MPYIKQEDKQHFDVAEMALLQTVGDRGISKGELNFFLTTVCKAYLAKHGRSYSIINDIVGALEGAKLEFYRRVAAPYEDSKIKENGDVY